MVLQQGEMLAPSLLQHGEIVASGKRRSNLRMQGRDVRLSRCLLQLQMIRQLRLQMIRQLRLRHTLMLQVGVEVRFVLCMLRTWL